MAHTPRTLRNPHPEVGGKPCIHFGDAYNHVLQVHAGDDGLGMVFSALLVNPFLGIISIEVELTPGQIGELMDHLRSQA